MNQNSELISYWPNVAEIISVLTLSGGYNSILVTVGTTFLGIAAGLVGAFAVLRKRALMGDALAHSGLPGLCIAFIIFNFWLGFERSLLILLIGATLSGVIGVLVVQGIVSKSRLTQDTAIGIVLSTFFGFGIVLLSIIQNLGTAKEGGLHHFIYGQTAALSFSEASTILGVTIIAIAITVLFLKEFQVVTFDQEFAKVQGWPIQKIDLLMMSSIVMVTVVGFQSVGMILIVALLIIPAVSAKFWSDKLKTILVLSSFFGGVSGYFGSAISATFPHAPAGAIIVLVAGSLFFISFIMAPAHGLLGTILRDLAIRLRIGKEHLLRECYEKIENDGDFKNREISISTLNSLKGIGFLAKITLLIYGQIKNLFGFSISKNSLTLSDLGFNTASDITLTHRLWEEYLHTAAGIDIDHVDYSADRVEHFITSEMLTTLKNELKNQGRLPEEISNISSLHPI